MAVRPLIESTFGRGFDAPASTTSGCKPKGQPAISRARERKNPGREPELKACKRPLDDGGEMDSTD